ncbi:carbonic anhydrase-related protein 10 [Caerostris extrusa]|uniref:Carbonic anhydrase-related protein 10 n=1 Tax=Caerostris extrusa TaxID=172846 RepID=A0AAV4Y0L7_CAEEX|nr:carbonic anhydrase-related protein 10 [Caerostris extrusa]
MHVKRTLPTKEVDLPLFAVSESSSPDFWGLLNPEWSFCTKGRRQSPIDLNPGVLLYDPLLKDIQVDKNRVSGTIMNTGHSIIFRSENLDLESVVNITEGPLSYKYRFEEIHLHYGRTDDKGSEHTLSGYAFPAELQILGYNSDLYNNISEALAMRRSEGVVAIAVLLQMGQEARLQHLSVYDLLPDTHFFMTYDGSLTMPGCQETVTWIVMNRPIFITKQQLYILRKLMQGAQNNQKAPLGIISGPATLNQRVVRTNIDFERIEGERSVPRCATTCTTKQGSGPGTRDDDLQVLVSPSEKCS